MEITKIQTQYYRWADFTILFLSDQGHLLSLSYITYQTKHSCLFNCCKNQMIIFCCLFTTVFSDKVTVKSTEILKIPRISTLRPRERERHLQRKTPCDTMANDWKDDFPLQRRCVLQLKPTKKSWFIAISQTSLLPGISICHFPVFFRTTKN